MSGAAAVSPLAIDPSDHAAVRAVSDQGAVHGSDGASRTWDKSNQLQPAKGQVMEIVYLLPVLGCAAMMGGMMWMMGRGKGSKADAPDPERAKEVQALRQEVADLRQGDPKAPAGG